MAAINRHSHEWLLIRKEILLRVGEARRALEIVGAPEDLTNSLRGEISFGMKLIQHVEGESGIIVDDTSEPLVI